MKIEINTPGENVTNLLPVGTILGVIQWIAIIVMVIMLFWVGIKYITAGAGTKADVKSNLIPMLVGAILIGLAPTIVRAVMSLFGVSVN